MRGAFDKRRREFITLIGGEKAPLPRGAFS
jgi:hypothetical protein